MKLINKYQAIDGSEHPSKSACILYEAMICEVREAMDLLKPVPKELNWKGYVQQHASSIIKCKTALFNIANKEGILKSWIDRQKTNHSSTDFKLINVTHPSWFLRMLDGGHRPLSNAYSRLCCIDKNFKEWNQPYYTTHQDENENVPRG